MKPPILRWDFLWKSYSDWSSKQIWTTNRSVYIMFFMDLVVFATQILAFAICFSWILRVGAVQANTFCANVRNSHEKTNNLKFKKAGFSAKSQRFPRFCTPSPQIWAENRRFAALAKRNRRKSKKIKENRRKSKKIEENQRKSKKIRQKLKKPPPKPSRSAPDTARRSKSMLF